MAEGAVGEGEEENRGGEEGEGLAEGVGVVPEEEVDDGEGGGEAEKKHGA